MENQSKELQQFDQSRLKNLVFQLESLEYEYNSRLKSAKIIIHKGVSFVLSAVAILFCILIYTNSIEAAIVLLLSSSILLTGFTLFSFSHLELFSKNIPQLFKRCLDVQTECEELLTNLIASRQILSLKDILQETQTLESSITALMASLIQSKRLVEHLDINTATYFYATDDSFFIAMKEMENTTPTNYSELVSNIQKQRYEFDSSYLEHFEHLAKLNNKFSKSTICLIILGVLSFTFISAQVSLFFFTFLFVYKGLPKALSHEKLHQKLDTKMLTEDHLEKGIKKCDNDLESLILLAISNHPGQKLQDIDSMLELGSNHLQDLLNDFVQSNKLKEDIDIESGQSMYSICDDYYMLATREELERDIFTRYLSHFNS